MRVFVPCEFSGVVRDAFIAKGHDAWSCDLLPTEAPGPHIQGNALEHLNDGWDLMIAFPPCTHLAVSGAAWFEKKRADGRQREGIDLFMAFAKADVGKFAIENPVGIMSTLWREPDQVIHPYYFGDEVQKATCLWLKNLPPLIHVKEDDLLDTKTHVGKGEFYVSPSGKRMHRFHADSWGNGHARSVTFKGIATQMAEQWGA